MTRDARLSALHRGGFGLPGPRFSVTGTRLRRSFSGHPDPSQRAPRSQVVVPDGRGPCLPGQRLQAAAAGRHTSLRLQDRLENTPPMSKAAYCLASLRYVVKKKIHFVCEELAVVVRLRRGPAPQATCRTQAKTWHCQSIR